MSANELASAADLFRIVIESNPEDKGLKDQFSKCLEQHSNSLPVLPVK
jgi:hypothetical protein